MASFLNYTKKILVLSLLCFVIISTFHCADKMELTSWCTTSSIKAGRGEGLTVAGLEALRQLPMLRGRRQEIFVMLHLTYAEV